MSLFLPNLPLKGTNASIERIFSSSKNIWTDKKAQLSVSKIKAILMVKYNIKLDCLQFYNSIKNKPNILEKIIGGSKYNASNENNQLVQLRGSLNDEINSDEDTDIDSD